MPRVLVELEINERGAEKIGQTSGSLKDLGQQSKKTSDALSSIFQGIGQAVGQRAFAAIEALPGALVAASAAAARALYDISAALVETGGRLADLSAKTSLSTDFLQKLGYAGELVGVSMEEISAAALKMEKGIADGDDVFARLGLSISKLRAMNPEDQFSAVAAQIAKIKDPTLQAAAAMEVFGKGGAQILPLLRSDIAAAAEEAERLGLVLSEKTISAADALGDEATKLAKAWEGVQNQFAAVIVESPELLQAFQSMVSLLGETARWVHDNRGALAELLKIAMGFGASAVTAFQSAASGAAKLASSLRLIQDAVPGMREALKAAEDLAFMFGAANRRSGLSASSRAMTEEIGFTAKGEAAAIAKRVAEIDKSYEATENEIRAFEIRTHQLATKETERFWKEQLELAEAGAKGLLRAIKTHQAEQDALATNNEYYFLRATTATDRFLNHAVDAVKGLQMAWQFVTVAVDAYTNAVAGARNGTEGAAMGALSGMQQGGQVAGPWGALAGFVVGGVAGWLGGKEAEQQIGRTNALNRINEHMDAANAILARLEEIRRKTQEVVSEGAQGLAAMFEGATSPEDFERLGRLALAGVEAMKAQGFSMLEIFRALRPALDAARERLQELGQGAMTGLDKFTGEEVSFLTPFEELLAFDELIQANEGLIASIEGTGAVLRMLQETGNLTGQSLTDILTQVGQDYDDLIAAGFTHQQALAIQADSLRELDRLQRDGLITVDALTQARIDEAKAAGLLDPTPQEQIKELMDLQLLVLVAQAQMLGVTLPAAVQEYIDSLNRVPTRIQTEVIFDGVARPGSPGAVTPSSEPGTGTMGGLITAAAGFGPRRLDVDTMFLAHAGEHVLIVPAGMPFGFESAADGFASFKTPIDERPSKFSGDGGGISAFKTAIGGGAGAQTTSSQLQSITAAVQEIAARPTVTVQSSPTIVVEDKSLVKDRDGQEAFARSVIPVIDRALRLNQEGLASRVKQIANSK